MEITLMTKFSHSVFLVSLCNYVIFLPLTDCASLCVLSAMSPMSSVILYNWRLFLSPLWMISEEKNLVTLQDRHC